MNTITIDLNKSPNERWSLSTAQIAAAGSLVDEYVTDLGGIQPYALMLDLYGRSGYIDTAYAEEMDALARTIGRSYPAVLLANLYYDAMNYAISRNSGPAGQMSIACSAFGYRYGIRAASRAESGLLEQ
jgi:hypothetical protein